MILNFKHDARVPFRQACSQPPVASARGQWGTTAWGNEMENALQARTQQQLKSCTAETLALSHNSHLTLRGRWEITVISAAWQQHSLNLTPTALIQCILVMFNRKPKSSRWKMSWCSLSFRVVRLHGSMMRKATEMDAKTQAVWINFQESQAVTILFSFYCSYCSYFNAPATTICQIIFKFGLN